MLPAHVNRIFRNLITNKVACKSRDVRKNADCWANNHSGYAFKYDWDLHDKLITVGENASILHNNVLPVFIDYNKHNITPLEAISSTYNIGFMGGDLDSLMGRMELNGLSLLFGASGLSRLYKTDDAQRIWSQLHALITSCYNTVILTDTHPDFFKLIESETHWHYVKNKYGVVRPDLNDTKISHVDLNSGSDPSTPDSVQVSRVQVLRSTPIRHPNSLDL
jgi:hypothetical protein